MVNGDVTWPQMVMAGYSRLWMGKAVVDTVVRMEDIQLDAAALSLLEGCEKPAKCQKLLCAVGCHVTRKAIENWRTRQARAAEAQQRAAQAVAEAQRRTAQVVAQAELGGFASLQDLFQSEEGDAFLDGYYDGR